jgi:FkbM family methyltransferase
MNRLHRLIRLLQWKIIHGGPRRDITIETWNGLLTCDSEDWLIGKYLYVNRSYERENILAVMDFLRSEGLVARENPGTVLDVGANIGMIAIALLKHGYFERAAAFEPEPNNYRLLVKNVEQNRMGSRILTFPCGLSSSVLVGHEHGVQAVMERSPDNFGDHRVRHSADTGFFHEENRSTLPVTLRTLAQVMSDSAALNAEEIRLIWVDIQGHEGHFFDGARKLLATHVPVVSEFWPYAIRRSGMSREEYLRLAGDLFTQFYVAEKGDFRRRPTAELGRLFDAMESPRSGGQIILVNEG